MHNPPEIPLIDIHSHSKEIEANVIRIHNIMAHEYSPEIILPGAYYSLGVHPWYIEECKQMPGIEDFNRKEIIAIGESGLDRLRGPDIESQEKIFRYHIEISESLEKPLIIHNVRMTERILKIHKEVRPGMPWILHGFSGNIDQTKQLLKHNFYFSFSERALKSQKSIDAFRNIPVERLFMETDDGEIKIEILYHEYCNLYELNISALQLVLHSNFQKIFNEQF